MPDQKSEQVVPWYIVLWQLWVKLVEACLKLAYPPKLFHPMTWEVRDGELLLNGAKYVTGRRYDRKWVAEQCDPLLDVIESSKRKLSILALAVEMPIAAALFDSRAITLRRLQSSAQEEDRLRLVIRMASYDVPLVICNHANQSFYQFWVEEPGHEVARVRNAAKLAEHLSKTA